MRCVPIIVYVDRRHFLWSVLRFMCAIKHSVSIELPGDLRIFSLPRSFYYRLARNSANILIECAQKGNNRALAVWHTKVTLIRFTASTVCIHTQTVVVFKQTLEWSNNDQIGAQ